ncbi:MAG: pyrimidine/purine nucleosidase domain-containing protein, partial [Candidatus Competibacterales bacterium]|nr:pyrimidine/purine nucleosidase domain-containing protein [Candidatus Competibacterales bacterium]
MKPDATLNARITPVNGLDVLSRSEVAQLRDASKGGLHELLRRCALAVLTSGSYSDDAQALFDRYAEFDIEVQQHDRGLWLELRNAPPMAFVDGRMIRGINELLFAVVRDIVYVGTEIRAGRFELDDAEGISDAVFKILRNARALLPRVDPSLVVCWGGHAIG